jgi:predicted MFS family arabinose efflux permease
MIPTLRCLAAAVDRVGGDYGVAYAAYNAAYAVGIMLGASLGGKLVDALGSGSALAFATCGALVLGVWPAIALGGDEAVSR